MNRWITILKIVVGVSLFGGLIWFIDPMKVWKDVREIGQAHFLLYGAAIFLIGLAPVQSLKFHYLLKSARSSATFLESFRIVQIGFLFNNFLPTNVGGDLIKSYLFKRTAPIGWGRIVGLVTLERVVGVLILIAYGLLFVLFKGGSFIEKLRTMEWQTGGIGTWGLYVLTGIIFLLLLGGLLFPSKGRTLFKKGKALVRDSWQGVLELGRGRAALLGLFALLFHLCRATGYFFFLLALGQPVLLQDIGFAVVFTSFVSLIPVSVGALGIKEGSLAIALNIFGVPFDIGITVGVLNRGMLFLVSLIGLAYYFSSGDRYVIPSQVEDEQRSLNRER